MLWRPCRRFRMDSRLTGEGIGHDFDCGDGKRTRVVTIPRPPPSMPPFVIAGKMSKVGVCPI